MSHRKITNSHRRVTSSRREVTNSDHLKFNHSQPQVTNTQVLVIIHKPHPEESTAKKRFRSITTRHPRQTDQRIKHHMAMSSGHTQANNHTLLITGRIPCIVTCCHSSAKRIRHPQVGHHQHMAMSVSHPPRKYMRVVKDPKVSRSQQGGMPTQGEAISRHRPVTSKRMLTQGEVISRHRPVTSKPVMPGRRRATVTEPIHRMNSTNNISDPTNHDPMFVMTQSMTQDRSRLTSGLALYQTRGATTCKARHNTIPFKINTVPQLLST